MAYERKTYDWYSVQQFLEGEWEEVTGSLRYKEARDDVRAYRENQPEIPVRIRRKMIKKGQQP